MKSLLFGCFYWARRQAFSTIPKTNPCPRANLSIRPHRKSGTAAMRCTTNRIRTQIGLHALAHAPVLENSARRHARYLTLNPEDGHGEHHPDNPHYTAQS